MSASVFRGSRTLRTITDTRYKSGGNLHSDVTTVVNSVSFDQLEDKSGVSNPEWQRQVRNHENATTGFSAGETKVYSKGRGYARSEIRLDTSSYARDITYIHSGTFPCALAVPTISSEAYNTALEMVTRKVRKKILESQRMVQGGVFVAEIRKTLHMIKHPAQAMQRYLRDKQVTRYKQALKKAMRNKGRVVPVQQAKTNIVSTASQLWLETRFGLLPFHSDIVAGAEALADLNFHPDYKPLRASHSYSEKGKSEKTSWTLTGGVGYDVLLCKNTKCSVRVYGEMTNQVNSVPHKFGVDLMKDFIPTLWELAPWSFLVDYFVNVGEVLDGCFIDTGLIKRLSMSYSNRAWHEHQFVSFYPVGATPPQVTGSHPILIVNKKQVARFETFPVNAPRLQFQLPMGGIKIANMGALIGSRFKGLSKAVTKSVVVKRRSR